MHLQSESINWLRSDGSKDLRSNKGCFSARVQSAARIEARFGDADINQAPATCLGLVALLIRGWGSECIVAAFSGNFALA